jgi:uncharacterized protein
MRRHVVQRDVGARAATGTVLACPQPVCLPWIPMIRPAVPADHAAILAMNAESVHFLSPLDAGALVRLDAQSAYHRVVEADGRAVAFLLALREGADYASPNYRWFCAHYDRFLYVDRIVVSQTQQGRGLGAMLYDDLFAFARAARLPRITCEFDLVPPNTGSEKFHARYGFSQVGSQWLGGGTKQVSLQSVELAPAASAG